MGDEDDGYYDGYDETIQMKINKIKKPNQIDWVFFITSHLHIQHLEYHLDFLLLALLAYSLGTF
jgi:hypothetical protein